MSNRITIYESGLCGYCFAAKALLEKKGWSFDSIVVDGRNDLRTEMENRTGRTSVPQIFIGEHHVGGFDDLSELESLGELDTLYQQTDQDSQE